MSKKTSVAVLIATMQFLCWIGDGLAQQSTTGEQNQASLPGFYVDDGDRALRWEEAWTKGITFKRSVRIFAKDLDVSGIAILPTHMVRETDQKAVDRTNVTFSGPNVTDNRVARIQKGTSTTIAVTVGGIDEPGVYRGEIAFVDPGDTSAIEVRVPLEINAYEPPNVVAQDGSKSWQLSLVNCIGGCEDCWIKCIDCWIARWLLPASTLIDSRNLQLKNLGERSAKIESVDVIVRSDNSGMQLSKQEITPPNMPAILDGQKTTDVNVKIRRAGIAPGQYNGNLELHVANGGDIVIPVDLKVRSGPLLVTVVLVIGLLVGRLEKFMRERGGPQADALRAVNELMVELKDLHEADRDLLEPQLEWIRQSVYRERLEKVSSDLDSVRDVMEILVQCRRLEDILDQESGDDVEALKEKIRILREKVALRQEVGSDYQQIVNAFLELQSATENVSGRSEPAFAFVKPAVTAGVPAAIRLHKRVEPSFEPLWQRRTRNFLASLSGLSNEVRAEATLWLVRPLLYFILIAMLVVVGLQVLYVKEGSTFGAGGITDYVGLLIWAMSADIAGRTLSNLQSAAVGKRR